MRVSVFIAGVAATTMWLGALVGDAAQRTDKDGIDSIPTTVPGSAERAKMQAMGLLPQDANEAGPAYSDASLDQPVERSPLRTNTAAAVDKEAEAVNQLTKDATGVDGPIASPLALTARMEKGKVTTVRPPASAIGLPGTHVVHGDGLRGPDCNNNGVPDSIDVNGVVATVVIDEGGIAIPDNAPAGIMRTYNVTESSGPVIDLNVGILISHTWAGDVIVTLSHGGQTATLIDRPGFTGTGFGSQADGFACILDDEGTGGPIENIPLGDGPPIESPPNYTPNSPLSVFDGLERSGIWTLTVSDNAAADTGTLDSWLLFFQDSPPTSQDCNQNGIPDECETDCNANGVPDDCDIANETSADCNNNNVPDECEAGDDCNGDGTPDVCDPDCNMNGMSDVCETLGGVNDCNFNMIPDECEVGGGRGTTPLFSQAVIPDDAGVGPGGLLAIGSSCPFNNTSAEDFTLAMTATINRVTWEGVYFGAASDFPGADMNFHITFYEDNGSGNVGAIIGNFPTVTVTKMLSSRPAIFGSNPVYAYSTTLPTPVTANGGQRYWVSINGNPNGAGGPVFGWVASEEGNASAIPGNDQPLQNIASACAALPATTYTPGGTAGDQDSDLAFALFGAAGGGDCNSNGIPDDCDIGNGTSFDCNANGVPDECEFEDCNTNGQFDVCEIAANPNLDLGGGAGGRPCDMPDGVLDECQDCNNNGIADCEDLMPGSGNVRTVVVNDMQAIPDCDGVTNQPINSVRNVTSADAPCTTVDELTVGLQINHTWVGDLVVTLTSPSGTTVTLMHRVGAVNPNPCSAGGGGPFGNSTDNINVTFDDAAAQSIETQTGVLNGTFQPGAAAGETTNPTMLAAFNGNNVCGTWTLTVQDDGGGDVGSLVSWTLNFRFGGVIPPFSQDCNANGVPDECDVADGASADCDGNGVPDECQGDCNGNGVADPCDILAGTSGDCNGNSIPDECEDDCNMNGVADECDIASGASDDCNKDGRPDECTGSPGGLKLYTVMPNLSIPDSPAPGVTSTFTVPDSGTMQDVNVRIKITHTFLGDLIVRVSHNGTSVDLWNRQCGGQDNMDVIFDDEGASDALCTDIPTGLRLQTADQVLAGGPGLSVFDGMDKAGDWEIFVSDNAGIDVGTLDLWTLEITNDSTGGIGLIDCNSNGLLDECDILFGLSTDCNGDGIPDECDFADCNTNGVNDVCDIDSGTSTDLNLDEIPDECQDCNNNGIPDFFDVAPSNIKYYSNTHTPPLAITNNSDAGITSTVNVQQFGPVVDVDVALAINHTRNGDLYVTLTSPAGTTVTLLSRPGLDETSPLASANQCCGVNNDGMDIVLNDGAPQSIETADSGGGILTGSYHPDAGASGNSGMLSAFNGENKFGVWTLTVRDGASTDTGALASWQLRLANNAPFSDDCNLNGIPDECEGSSDCNSNGVSDACELAGNDCNANNTPDECDIASGTSSDCNANGTPDECDTDCNANGVADECDIAGGTSADCNTNGLPDECEEGAPVQSMASSMPGLAIPDATPAGVNDTIMVAEGGTISDLDVAVNITHTWAGDLRVTLTHNGVTAILVDQPGLGPTGCGGAGIQNDGFNIVLDDEGTGGPIEDVGGCTAGDQAQIVSPPSYVPNELLSAFDGMDKAGAWTMNVSDRTAADLGTFNSWTLTFETPGNPDANSNGILDECEGNCTTPVVAWVHSVATHKLGGGVTGEFFVDLNLDNNPATRTSEPRDSGLRVIEVQFDQNVVSAGLQVTGPGGPMGGGAMTLGIGGAGPQSLGRIDLGAQLPNAQVYSLTITASSGPGCDLTQNVCVVGLAGDFNDNDRVTAADKGELVGFVAQPITQLNAKYDIQTNGPDTGTINTQDVGAWTGFFGTDVTGAACP